ncbi:hypothetical protein EDD52_106122 [Primorskyibacter sedentarius]|uniref:Uncharacterized protein n=1 Tax=Primorskyibacter sedentarius TaxID=745311 RepID=A0A4R3JDN7_9RHOB|nr:hypothetical protein [Primorskyibacter sedentarius]TCS63854.1 hypothetical protein EDD52_106122 [Primorskyibacter sedentarius]
MSAQTLAIIYAALAALPMAMHIALSLGAPLGRITVGGRFSGRLPCAWRGLALVQAALLLAMGCAVLDRGGVLSTELPDAAFWLALALTLLTALANGITPSRPERMLWGPVTFAMSVAAIGVAAGGFAP